jgi:hypothetical protein
MAVVKSKGLESGGPGFSAWADKGLNLRKEYHLDIIFSIKSILEN